MTLNQVIAATTLAATLFVAALSEPLPLNPITPMTRQEYEDAQIDPATLVKGSMVTAKMVYPVGGFKAGETVEIIRGSGQQKYLIRRLSGGKTLWVTHQAVEITPDPETNREEMTPQQLERYVNERDFASDTEYFLWVDIDRQKTYVFKGADKAWTLYDTFDCATGLNAAPTVRGKFKISDRGTWFYSDQYAQGGKYWVRFSGSYLFHSLPFEATRQEIVDYTLGERASHGCVRLEVEDSKWIYDNIMPGTLTWVY